jgi:hypothetical protein
MIACQNFLFNVQLEDAKAKRRNLFENGGGSFKFNLFG